jgi:hypothetical protein
MWTFVDICRLSLGGRRLDGRPAEHPGMEEMNLALMEEVVETLAEVERMTTLMALLNVMVEEYQQHTQECDGRHPGRVI